MSVLIHPREIRALRSRNYDTEILHRNAVNGVNNAMPTRYELAVAGCTSVPKKKGFM